MAVLLCSWLAAAAMGQSQSIRFDITNPDMSEALREYARVSGQQIIFTEDLVAGIAAVPLTGDFTAGAALNRLLAGTGLASQQSPSGAVMIVRASAGTRAQRPAPSRERGPAASPATSRVPATARTQAPAEIESITVSASRIRVEGYEAPTPVTVLGLDAIQREAKIDVGDLIRDLPSFGPSSSPGNSQQQAFITSGITGLNLVSLRNLGFNRNLVLFDGQRVVTSSIQGGVDMSTLPATLVERIEVVTGGASATWGSDAVTGVVNVILNKDFTGLEVNAETGDNFAGRHGQRKYEASYGQDFAGGRGHFIVSGAYTDSPDEYYSYDIPGHRYQALVNNPGFAPGNGQPRLVHADHVGLARATPGGLITSGPLAGTNFVGKEAHPEPFNAGNVTAGYYSNGGTLNTSESDIGLVSIPSRTSTLFGFGSFRLTDTLSGSVQLNRGRFRSTNNSWSYIRYGNVPITADNPYIPAPTRLAMEQLGVTEFMLGTMNRPGYRPDLADQAASLGVPVIDTERELDRSVFTLDGSINDAWSWTAYYQYGKSRLGIFGRNNVQPARYNLAVDAVRVTPANAGTSGLPVGTIVCRSTLNEPGNGCLPLNVFGEGNASPGAIAYVNGAARSGGHTLNGEISQTVGSFLVNGVLPFGTNAGGMSAVVGTEYRKEEGTQHASPAAQSSTFQLGNFKDFSGKYHTRELFIELSLPLLQDSWVKSLAIDAAGRLTDYSTSGGVETYKFGLVSQLSDSVRLRGSYSLDIRAPQLFDLFNKGLPVTGKATDPNTNLPVTIFTTSRGNPDLKPEESTTLALGLVLTPRWISGLTVSIDYYDIAINGAFATFAIPTTLAQCVAGNAFLCSNLAFEGPGGALSEVFSQPLNADNLTTSGLDLALDYRSFIGQGALNLRAVANYQLRQDITQLGTTFDYIGSVGRDSPHDGAPRVNATLGATYVLGDWSGTVQTRINGKARVNSEWGPRDIDDNEVPAVYYLDLRSSYRFAGGVQMYLALDNVLDRDPPPVPFTVSGASVAETPFVDSIHDAFGRVWRAGVRAKF